MVVSLTQFRCSVSNLSNHLRNLAKLFDIPAQGGRRAGIIGYVVLRCFQGTFELSRCSLFRNRCVMSWNVGVSCAVHVVSCCFFWGGASVRLPFVCCRFPLVVYLHDSGRRVFVLMAHVLSISWRVRLPFGAICSVGMPRVSNRAHLRRICLALC